MELGKQKQANQPFVHYTSTEVFEQILKSKSFWLRKADAQADYTEIDHGIGLWNFGRQHLSERFLSVFEEIQVGLVEEIDSVILETFRTLKQEVYLGSVSVHTPKEDQDGRLSMWRHYGRQGGVAIVVKPTPFFSDSDGLGVFSSCVMYFSREEFLSYIADILARVERCSSQLKALGAPTIAELVKFVAVLIAMCSKHPSYHEEQERRIFYAPKLFAGAERQISIVHLKGVMQQVCKIPFEDFSKAGVPDMEMNKLLQKIIIGPQVKQALIADAIVQLLSEQGFDSPQSRVIRSTTPEPLGV